MIIIGIGPGNPKYLTEDAKVEIKRAENVYAFRRIAKDLEAIRADIKVIEKVSDMVNIKGENDAILATGDALFFGIANTFLNKNIKIDRVVPGISSSQYFLSKMMINTNNYNSISFHGRELDLSMVKKGINVFFTDSTNTADSISKKLYEEGYRGRYIAGYNLSYEDEKIIDGEVGEGFEYDSTLALSIYINEMD